jgi:hypothetical protein
MKTIFKIEETNINKVNNYKKVIYNNMNLKMKIVLIKFKEFKKIEITY